MRGADGEGPSRAVGLLVDRLMERDGDGVPDRLTDGVAVRECVVLIDAEDDGERVSVALVVEGDVVGVAVTAAASAAG